MNSALSTTLLLVTFLALSFLLSGMEAGVFALSRLRVRQQMRAGRASARALHGFLQNSERFLWTIFVGNTLVNVAFLGWVVATLYRHFSHSWISVVAFAAIVFLFYALFDLLPKMIFRAYPNRLCMFWAQPFRIVYVVLRPLVALVEWVSTSMLGWTGGKAFSGHLFGNREELRQVMQDSAQSLSSDERAMVNRVMDLPSLTVRQITKPLAEAVTVTTKTTLNEALALGREHGLTRMPVWDATQTPKRIVGLINLNTLLFQPNLEPEKLLAEFVKPALYLAEDERLEVALRRMQRGGQRLAVVLNRQQRETGIITLEDVLKVVFGEVKL